MTMNISKLRTVHARCVQLPLCCMKAEKWWSPKMQFTPPPQVGPNFKPLQRLLGWFPLSRPRESMNTAGNQVTDEYTWSGSDMHTCAHCGGGGGTSSLPTQRNQCRALLCCAVLCAVFCCAAVLGSCVALCCALLCAPHPHQKFDPLFCLSLSPTTKAITDGCHTKPVMVVTLLALDALKKKLSDLEEEESRG